MDPRAVLARYELRGKPAKPESSKPREKPVSAAARRLAEFDPAVRQALSMG